MLCKNFIILNFLLCLNTTFKCYKILSNIEVKVSIHMKDIYVLFRDIVKTKHYRGDSIAHSVDIRLSET